MYQKIKLKNTGNYVLVSEEDFNFLNSFIWNENKRKNNSYAMTGSANNRKYMHRLLLQVTDFKIQVDHINGNGLDNTRENLRLCSSRQNSLNRKKRKNVSSRYKGVYWSSSKKKWRVSVGKGNGKSKWLGNFDSEIEAAKKYDSWALSEYKEFAKLNFPTDKE